MYQSFIIDKPGFDIKAYMLNQQCPRCLQFDCDFVSECGHFYHISCLSWTYFYYQACVVCNTELSLPFFETLDKSLCRTCKNQNNLLNCSECFCSYCYKCLINKKTSECCQKLKVNLNNYFTTCPGCLYERSYNDLVPITCGNHSLLCKKCWSLCILNKKCILECESSYFGGIYCKCESCDCIEIKYHGELVCPNNCSLCELCVINQSMKQNSLKQQPSCVYCGNNLIPKTTNWVD